FPFQALSWCGCYDTRKRFDLTLKAIVTDVKPPVSSAPSLRLIETILLVVGETKLPVSKELLEAYSPFFDTLFNGDYREKQSGIFKIKVSHDDFIWFIKSLHKRSWEFSSMDRALTALSYADQYGMMHLHRRVVPFLRENKLPNEQIKETLVICTRFHDNEEIIGYLLEQCEDYQ
ncbi:hypothetical protein PFISCL1PPCAC_25592, partial [Pristionchus fissidentatus]